APRPGEDRRCRARRGSARGGGGCARTCLLARRRSGDGFTPRRCASIGVGIATTVVAAVAAPERITSLWVSATIADEGSAQVEEVIDYDFGGHQRHGIFRTVPGLRTSAP